MILSRVKPLKKAQYGGQPLIEPINLLDYQLNPELSKALETNADFKKLFIDVINTGLALNKKI